METSQSGYCLVGNVAGTPAKVVLPADGLKIGRSHECDLPVRDEEVSRLHCVVRVEGKKVTVEDKSQNGTLVNGNKIDRVAELKVGDVLKIGATEFTLQDYVSKSKPVPDEDAAALKPGDLVDRYRVKRLIGKGGMGTVYEVVHTGLDLPRALKALTLPDDPAYAAFREKFLDEGKILARLRHENITQVHDAAYDEKTRTLFFVMDLVLYDDGRPCTLADVSYDECDVSSWFASLASALDYIHGQGIVHSDIKLQNVLVSPGQKIKLADFGVAHLMSGKMRTALRGDASDGSKDTVGYTAHYASPELLKPGGMPSVASDVYALGVLLVRLLSGKWYDEHPKVLAEIASKRTLNWRPILMQMLAADPKRRATNLMSLVLQLRKGSSASARRKYQIENRRRRNQKIKLTRVQTGRAPTIRTPSFTPETWRDKLVRWSVPVAIALVLVWVFVRLHNRSAAEKNRETARIELLQSAREGAQAQLKAVRGEIGDWARQHDESVARPLQEFAFVRELSLANVTGSTDRASAEGRNEMLVRYGELLKAVSEARAVLAGLQDECEAFDGQIPAFASTNAASAAVGGFIRKIREAEAALEAKRADERQAWSAYEESKVQIDRDRARADQIRDIRRRTADVFRQTAETEAELRATPEWTEARESFLRGDRAIEGDDGGSEAESLYAAACASLSNGCERLRARREESAAISNSLLKCDEDLRLTQLANLRRGQCSLAIVARHAKETSERFAAKWEAECADPSNRVAVAADQFYLTAVKVYLEYLTKRLPGTRDDLTFSLSANGVDVDNGKFKYPLPWNEIFSTRKLGVRLEEKFRQAILAVCDVPSTGTASARLLVGRWIALNELLPDLNTPEQKTRLAEAIRRNGEAEVLAWARRALPEDFPAEIAPVAAAPAAPVAQTDGFLKDLPTPERDVLQERVIYFAPNKGLKVPALGEGVAEIAWCKRIKDSPRCRFQVGGGYVFEDTGARKAFADVGPGESFLTATESEDGKCRYELISWIDNAFGDNKPIVLVRCQFCAD